MLLTWLKNRRRRRLLATPISPQWLAYFDDIAHYRLLPSGVQSRLRDLTRIFIAEREFEGCKGLAVTDEMRVTIAALACLMLLGLRDYYYDNVVTILLYPEGYVAPDQTSIGSIVLEDAGERLGEAHYRGPLILSWADVHFDAGQTGQGSNLVFHEFAHQLDMVNGAADGVPRLPPALQRRWQQVLGEEYRRLCRRAAHGRRTLIDPYGSTNPAEFFAVVTECFFDLPGELQLQHPDLYDLFRAFYQQDPASRLPLV